MNYMKILNDKKEIISVLNEFKQILPSLKSGRVNIDDFADKILKNGHLCVFSQDQTIQGFSAFYANDTQNKVAYLTMIAVKEEYRREGIGDKLLSFVEKESKLRGMNQLKLEVSISNLGAIKFYEKHGFCILEQNENAYYMIKNL